MHNKKRVDNIFLRLHPLHRIAISLSLSLILFIFLRKQDINPLLLGTTLWCVFSFSYIVLCWVVLFTRPVSEIRKKAVSDDGSMIFVFVMILVSSFASLFTVLQLMISKHQQAHGHTLFIPVCIGGMLLSWIMVHTVFTFHYAHKYYGNDELDKSLPARGLDFPREVKPGYIDFAYFAFVIGCTFQVSDVQITSGKIRRIVLLHGLLSFVLNTFVVALTINFIASLMN